MPAFILTGAAMFFAWALGLSLIRMKPAALCFNAGITGALAAILHGLAEHMGMMSALPMLCLGLLLAETVVVQLQIRGVYGNTVLASCIACGSFALLYPMCLPPVRTLSLGVFTGIVVISAMAWHGLKARFPGNDWQEAFVSPNRDASRLDLRPRHVYMAAMAVCAGNTALAAVSGKDIPGLLLPAAAGLLLLWGGLLLIILMIHYKKERLTVLMEQQFRAETQAFMNVIRSQRHDYNFHVQTIAGLMAADKIEECRAYVRALEKDSAEMNLLLPIRDPALSATLFSFRSLAIREGIELRIDIGYDLSQLATNVYETNKILSNLLQNALDEVSTHPDKSDGIGLTVLKRGEFCVIRVSNRVLSVPTAEQLGKLCEQGYTTKQGHEGVGLSAVSLLARKVHGIVYAQTEGDMLHMIAKIPILTVKGEEE